MTEQTVTGALEKADNSPASIIEKYRNDIALVLPSHIKADTWVRVAIGALRRDPKLMEAAANDPMALMASVMDAARQGLEPGTEQYYLTPRKVKGRLTILGIRGYQGEIELIYRAGAVSSVIVEVVREKDTFRYTPGRDDRPVHEIDWDSDDRGALRLAYAYALMKDGAVSKVVVLNRTAIAQARKFSQGADSDYSPWKTSEEAMWLKTAVHRLQKWVPTSAEYIREQLRAARDVANEIPAPDLAALPPAAAPQHVDVDTGEVFDGEVIDTDTEAPSWP